MFKILDSVQNPEKTFENWTTTLTNPATFYRTTISNFVLENKISFKILKKELWKKEDWEIMDWKFRH